MNEWCFRHDSTLKGCNGPGKSWPNEMIFLMNHAPGAGSIAQPVWPVVQCAIMLVTLTGPPFRHDSYANERGCVA